MTVTARGSSDFLTIWIHTLSPSRDPISELGRQLVRQIKAFGLNGPLSIPSSSIILVGYDIGGLIVKQVSVIDAVPTAFR